MLAVPVLVGSKEAITCFSGFSGRATIAFSLVTLIATVHQIAIYVFQLWSGIARFVMIDGESNGLRLRFGHCAICTGMEKIISKSLSIFRIFEARRNGRAYYRWTACSR